MQFSKGLAGIVCVLVFVLSSAAVAQEQGTASGAPPSSATQQQVPVIDGALGPCSVEITVKRPNGKVVDGAKVSVHIAYGFLNVRRLDLEVPTNNEGRARITGLPENLKHGLLFHGAKDNLLGTAFVDPAKTCDSKHELVLVEQAPADQTDQSSGSQDSGSKDSPNTQDNKDNKNDQSNPK